MPKTQADRFADFIAESAKHAPPHARGTVRRFLEQHAEFIGDDVVRFRDGSAIARADLALATEPPKQSRGMGR
jgi:hypothetical protein